ncbi:MAG: ribosomal protein S18-alanine N-acetyltransferase [Chloroflexota bacterium]|nr:ribosomal protein S18-alanine N-acetyltransferase [Chloroflexota bacterium]MDE2930481.1 ribosomal protein S18-alanine N-acetyltransferase [Chloroflexota bacterium]
MEQPKAIYDGRPEPHPMKLRIEPMELEDVGEVRSIEEACFTLPWPRNAYRREIVENKLARYLVIRDVDAVSDAATDVRVTTTNQMRPRPFPLSLLPSVNRESEDQWRYGKPTLVAYGGLWLMVDEAHITTIASRPDVRGQYVGELMLTALIDVAIGLAARWVTLEVRVSNSLARSLYKKYSFRSTGIRPRYYSDNHEDALVMWSEDVNVAGFQKMFQKRIASLRHRHSWTTTYPETGGFLDDSARDRDLVR